VRTDPNKDQDFVLSKEWQSSGKLKFFDKDKEGKKVSNSFSGNERDHLYLNRGGKSFMDVSALSGLDLVTDGRSFAYLDYDQDGWLDIALASANAPQLQLMHNEMAESIKEVRNHVRLKLVGGNTSSKPSASLSNRDGYGAKITATLDNGLTIYREHHCGAGMSAQNSNTIHLGIGTASSIRELKVIWPSGKTQTIKNIPSGALHEIREEKE
jgi:hypothetical protein